MRRGKCRKIICWLLPASGTTSAAFGIAANRNPSQALVLEAHAHQEHRCGRSAAPGTGTIPSTWGTRHGRGKGPHSRSSYCRACCEWCDGGNG
jgi:hypothetical protein